MRGTCAVCGCEWLSNHKCTTGTGMPVMTAADLDLSALRAKTQEPGITTNVAVKRETLLALIDRVEAAERYVEAFRASGAVHLLDERDYARAELVALRERVIGLATKHGIPPEDLYTTLGDPGFRAARQAGKEEQP